MTYEIIIRKSALKALENIPEPDFSKINKTISALARNPRPNGYIKLQGRNGFRVRQGDYRIIYQVLYMKLVVDVIPIGHRKDIYE